MVLPTSHAPQRWLEGYVLKNEHGRVQVAYASEQGVHHQEGVHRSEWYYPDVSQPRIRPAAKAATRLITARDPLSEHTYIRQSALATDSGSGMLVRPLYPPSSLSSSSPVRGRNSDAVVTRGRRDPSDCRTGPPHTHGIITPTREAMAALDVRPGLRLDVRDSFGKWNSGKVVQLHPRGSQYDRRFEALRIKFDGQFSGDEYDEWVPVNGALFASSAMYSSVYTRFAEPQAAQLSASRVAPLRTYTGSGQARAPAERRVVQVRDPETRKWYRKRVKRMQGPELEVAEPTPCGFSWFHAGAGEVKGLALDPGLDLDSATTSRSSRSSRSSRGRDNGLTWLRDDTGSAHMHTHLHSLERERPASAHTANRRKLPVTSSPPSKDIFSHGSLAPRFLRGEGAEVSPYDRQESTRALRRSMQTAGQALKESARQPALKPNTYWDVQRHTDNKWVGMRIVTITSTSQTGDERLLFEEFDGGKEPRQCVRRVAELTGGNLVGFGEMTQTTLPPRMREVFPAPGDTVSVRVRGRAMQGRVLEVAYPQVCVQLPADENSAFWYHPLLEPLVVIRRGQHLQQQQQWEGGKSQSILRDSYAPFVPESLVHAWSLRRRAVGIKNLGNTCYMNAAISLLCSSKFLMGYFLDVQSWHGQRSLLPGTHPLVDALVKLMHALTENGASSAISPQGVKEQLDARIKYFRGYQQHDCQVSGVYVCVCMHVC
jgi:hypothetical protein